VAQRRYAGLANLWQGNTQPTDLSSPLMTHTQAITFLLLELVLVGWLTWRVLAR
jgi:hypothetical protein